MKKLILILLGLPVLGCSTTSTQSNRGYTPNPVFGVNPAPKNMSPPDAGSEDSSDPTHMRPQADYHFSLGESYSLNGDSNRAIEEFKLTTIYDSQSATVRLRLGGEYLRQGLLTEAVEQAEAAEKLDANDTDVQMFLGGLYSALKMYKQAQEKYALILAKSPQNAEVMVFLGALMAEQERFDEAESYFLKAAKVPDSDKGHLAYYYLGKMRASQGDAFNVKAEAAFTHSLSIKPDFEDSVIALSELYTAENQKEKGIKLLESFQEQFGPKKSIAFSLSQVYLEKEDYDKAFKHLHVLEGFEPTNLNVKVKIALILIEKKQYDPAIEKLEEVIALAPGSDKIRFYLGAVYEETEHADLAIDNYKKIESSSTYFPDAMVHAAHLYRTKNDLKAASSLLQTAIAARDDVPQFYAFYASILDEEHQYSKGVTLLESSLKKFPDNTQLRFYLGSMYDHLGRTEDTIAEMRKILVLDGEYVQALNYLAYTFAEQGKSLDEAESMSRKAMTIQPNDPFILDTVGWVLFKQGRVEDAIQYLETAFKYKSDESVIAEHLGDAYYVFELTDKAKEMYQKAAANENDPTKATKIRAKILSLQARPNTHERRPASADMPAK